MVRAGPVFPPRTVPWMIAGVRAAAFAVLASLAWQGTVPPALGQTQIARTVHNLTPDGPGQLKETRPTGLCVYCHTPHNANPTQALWNRTAYEIIRRDWSSDVCSSDPLRQADMNRAFGS